MEGVKQTTGEEGTRAEGAAWMESKKECSFQAQQVVQGLPMAAARKQQEERKEKFLELTLKVHHVSKPRLQSKRHKNYYRIELYFL